MYRIRQYAILAHSTERLPQGRQCFWRLFREGRSGESRTDELFEWPDGESAEDGLTKACQFLASRGERVVGISSCRRSMTIFTEQMQTEASRDTRSTTAVEQEYLASGLGMG